MIPCTELCKYQFDGLCHLSRTSKNIVDDAEPNDRCLNFTPRSNKNGNRLPDVLDLD